MIRGEDIMQWCNWFFASLGLTVSAPGVSRLHGPTWRSGSVVKVTAGPIPCSAPPEKATTLVTSVLTTHRLAVQPSGSAVGMLAWWSPNTSSNGLPPGLEMMYGTFCNRSVGSTDYFSNKK